jgi:hypothetical protein
MVMADTDNDAGGFASKIIEVFCVDEGAAAHLDER